MILSKRERYAAIIATVIIGLFVVDYYALEPLLAARKDLENQIDNESKNLKEARRLVKSKPRLLADWKDKVDGGLTQDDAQADSQVQHAMQDWARAAQLNLEQFRFERIEAGKQFRRIVYHASGKGPMASVTRFLWSIQTARIPLRVTNLQVGAQKPGVDDLHVQLDLSTPVLVPESQAGQPDAAATIRRPAGGKD